MAYKPQPIAVAEGGTAANTAAGARTNLGITRANLGAAASGVNTDITQLNGLDATGKANLAAIFGSLPGLKLITVAAIDLTSGSTNVPLYQPAVGKNFAPLIVWADNVSVTGFTLPCTTSLGSFNSSYTDWAALATLAFNSLKEYHIWSAPSTILSTIDNSNFFSLHIGTGATATTLTADFHLIGFEY